MRKVKLPRHTETQYFHWAANQIGYTGEDAFASDKLFDLWLRPMQVDKVNGNLSSEFNFIQRILDGYLNKQKEFIDKKYSKGFKYKRPRNLPLSEVADDRANKLAAYILKRNGMSVHAFNSNKLSFREIPDDVKVVIATRICTKQAEARNEILQEQSRKYNAQVDSEREYRERQKNRGQDEERVKAEKKERLKTIFPTEKAFTDHINKMLDNGTRNERG